MNIWLRPLSMQRSYYGRPKTIALPKTWPNETGYVFSEIRDIAKSYATFHTQTRHNATPQWNVTQGNPQHDSENGMFQAKIRYVATESDIAKHYVTLRKLRDVVHTNMTQRNIWIKCDATKPAAWLSENITLCGKKIRDVTTALHSFQNVGQHGLESMTSLFGVCNILSRRVSGSECDVTRNPL